MHVVVLIIYGFYCAFPYTQEPIQSSHCVRTGSECGLFSAYSSNKLFC